MKGKLHCKVSSVVFLRCSSCTGCFKRLVYKRCETDRRRQWLLLLCCVVVTDCKDDRISNLVPIIVGAALGALILIVLIAYLIGRKRSRRGYEQVW